MASSSGFSTCKSKCAKQSKTRVLKTDKQTLILHVSATDFHQLVRNELFFGPSDLLVVILLLLFLVLELLLLLRVLLLFLQLGLLLGSSLLVPQLFELFVR